MAHARSRTLAPGDSGLLTLGFLALTAAVLVAHTSPATGYEVSVYSGTPLAFWLLFAVALSIALAVAFRSATPWSRRIALVLAGGATAVFVGLPLLRGYRFYGAGDALTHLGWIRGIRAGNFLPTGLFYPGFHSIVTLIGTTFGIDPAQATLLTIVLFSVLFFAFVSLSTALLFESRYSGVVGAFSAFFLLPITNLSTFIVAHPMSQGILFSAVAIYLLLKYVRGSTPAFSVSATGVLLAIASVGLVVYHPQLAAHTLVVFIAAAVLQALYRRFRPNHPIAYHEPIYAQTAVLALVFLLWISNHGFFADVIEFAVSNVIEYFTGDGAAAEAVDSQTGSLSEIGGSVVELAVKMLGVAMFYGGLAGLLILYPIANPDTELVEETDGRIPYFVAGLIGLTGLFGVYYLGNVSEMYFRVFGFMLAFVTILGAVALSYALTHLVRNRSTTVVYGAGVVVFSVLLAVSLLAVFPSPYIYNSSPHVTDMSMSGHEAAIENAEEDVEFVGIRAGPKRYMDATRAQLQHTRGHDGAVTESELEEGLDGQYADDRYLTVTRNDYDREVIAYKELRYSQESLASLPSQPGVDRVQSNGEFQLYYIHGDDDAE